MCLMFVNYVRWIALSNINPIYMAADIYRMEHIPASVRASSFHAQPIYTNLAKALKNYCAYYKMVDLRSSAEIGLNAFSSEHGL